MNKGYIEIRKLYLPKSCAVAALDWMYHQGKKHKEGVALFAGIRQEGSFYIKRTIIPQQYAGSFNEGLLYVVEGAELHRINVELFDTGMHLIAQIHSHPTEAYHSDTDDDYPIVTVLGGVSIVVPNFGNGGLNVSEWALYRFYAETGWTLLTQKEKIKFLILVDDESPQLQTSKKPSKFWPWG
ncbi:JAB domain-containing protein similar to deubiquitination enzymes [Lacibacter cauensis]|uniref:JAB domain-containing protein similar to deubiquitination enzymes n=1 Tax=Lacibacter cauensis TaxID=510947 RepID=A0A562S961_9BACT|nr:Mov34/MPN/PAD-1 family protein [Lacibacter cauensis]TWI77951.1 JAB domain-containing protein similar to deubiquitination enzymes [Lacibacter cauensis]